MRAMRTLGALIGAVVLGSSTVVASAGTATAARPEVVSEPYEYQSFGLSPGAALGASPKFSPGSAGIGDPYFPLDGNGGYDVGHYDLDVTYRPATDELTGVATIRARATKNLSRFNLDFDGLSVRSIEVNGKRAKWTRADGELTVTPRAGLRKGARFTVVVRYDGVPETIFDLFGTSGFVHTDEGALVVGQPHVAATWFPANDHPSDKASFTFKIKVPAGLEAIANGVLKSQRTSRDWATWTWDAKEPMAPYLAGMAIGEFDVRAYKEDGIRYWDAIASVLLEDQAPAISPVHGDQFLYSGIGEPAYKRLTRTIEVPAGGAQLSFQVNRMTEPAWDFLFVEARTAGGSDWTTLPDANGHTSQDPGACPGPLEANPFLGNYLTDVPPDLGDPDDPADDVFFPCDPVGLTGTWNAASGASDGWETWSVAVPNADPTPKQVEVSITYASDQSVQFRGVVIDDIQVSTGEGSTSFEADADPLDGWVAPITGPEGSADNPNTWDLSRSVAAVPGVGHSALVSFDRQPEIIKFEESVFGGYPFSAAGGIVDRADIFFALENQTRPIYSEFFFGAPEGNDFVVVHELAHMWFGDSLALKRWQDIWLNEGFATYAEWLWSEREGFGTAQENFDSFTGIPADDPFWTLAIGDPGPGSLFDFPVYGRGAMTLHALRLEVGDADFFRILRGWATTRAGDNVTTAEFIQFAERTSNEQLDDLFNAWLSTGKPDVGPALQRQAAGGSSVANVPAAVRSLAERLHDRPGQPFSDAGPKER